MPRQPLSLRDQIGAAMPPGGAAPPSAAGQRRQAYLGAAARPTPQMAQPAGMGMGSAPPMGAWGSPSPMPRPPMAPPQAMGQMPPPQAQGVPPAPQPMQNPSAPNVAPGAIGVIQPRFTPGPQGGQNGMSMPGQNGPGGPPPMQGSWLNQMAGPPPSQQAMQGMANQPQPPGVSFQSGMQGGMDQQRSAIANSLRGIGA